MGGVSRADTPILWEKWLWVDVMRETKQTADVQDGKRGVSFLQKGRD